ncbi:MAG: nuclear transport factor 2 family protein [Bacteroidota bacterium]
MKKPILTFLVVLSICLQGISQNYVGDKRDIDQILENAAAFSEYYVNGDADKIVASYTKDGKIFPSGQDIQEGPKALLSYWTPREGYKGLSHKITPVEIKIMGDEAYDYGYYEGTSQNPKGEVSSWKGKYLIIWKRVGNDWKMYLDIWNRM